MLPARTGNRTMRRPALIVLLVGVAAVAAMLCVPLTSGDVKSSIADNSESSARLTSSAAATDMTLQRPDTGPSRSAVPDSRGQKFVLPSSFLPSSFATTTRVVGRAHKLMAVTEEDKVWLATHGFPTLAEVEWSKQVSLEELALAAKSSTAMAALYGERAWEQLNFKEGKKVLWEATANGSVYAAEAMALKILRDGAIQADGRNAGAFEAAGWLLYASYLGDYRAADDLANHFGGMSSSDLGMAVERSFGIEAEVNEIRARRGLPPLRRSVRPSMDVYHSMDSREGDVVPR